MTESVNRVRGIARWVVRSTAIVLAATGTFLILQRVIFGALLGDANLIAGLFTEIGNGHRVSNGLALLVLAAGLALTGDRLVRWAIPVPPADCPRCGHAADPDDGPPARCPECGLPRGSATAARPTD